LVGLIDHVTFVLASPETVAVNCCVWPCPRIAVPGATVTVTGGTRLTLAVADFEVSETLVAVTVTVWAEVTVAGAVYSPAPLIVPVPAGEIDQVTFVLASPVTVAVNCRVAEGPKLAVVGDTMTEGRRVRTALPLLELSATLVATTVTVCCDEIVAGAV